MYDSYRPIYIFSAPIMDSSGTLYVTFSGEMGDYVLGMSAETFEKKQQGWSEQEYEAFLESLNFKNLNILIKPQVDTYNGQPRVRYFAQKVVERNLVKENTSLLQRLEVFDEMPLKNKQDDAVMANNE